MKRVQFMVVLATLWAGICQAQQVRNFPLDCTLPQLTMRNNGDLVRIMCDSVWILSNLKFKEFAGESIKLDSLQKLYKTLYQEDEQIINLKDQVIAHLDSISRIEDKAYSDLSLEWAMTDSIAKESFENTNNALKEARAVTIASYVASGLSGGIVTGLATGTKDHPFQLGYAAAGLALGLGINYLVLDIFK